MKNKWVILTLIQAIISLVAGILFSKMSLMGRIGVSTFYTEYGFLKHWYKGFAAVFIIQLLLIAVLWIVKRITSYKNFSIDRKSTRLNSSHVRISYAVFCLKKKKKKK